MSFLEPVYGFLAGFGWSALLLFATALTLAFLAAPLRAWTAALGVAMFAFGAPVWAWLVLGVPALVFNLPALRRALVSGPLLRLMKAMKFLPAISETERVAIEAGTVWVDGELFSGRPDFARLLAESYPDLDAEARAFLAGPVEEVCSKVTDWDVHQRRDLPPEVWQYLKDHRFLGMIIPKEYGGLGFTASANSAVVQKCTSRCAALGITVMVPNSLGPAELLVHYGTDEQKNHYLPKLASGEYVPCFALTEPGAGSDAGAMSSRGEVFRGEDRQLYLRLNWNKRYITLAAVSNLLGIAFKVYDPGNLLGKGVDLGITCALIPTETEGVELGRQHDPLGVPFYNCPTQGHDVVVPVDAIIGGAEGAGHGWKMLMESLAAGRGISLPASATATTKVAARVAGAYAAVRKQFGLAIGKFEGIEEPLARIGGTAWLLEAARRYTCGGLDGGAKPAVVTAMAKYNFTELARAAVNDAMDVQGGAAISRGPRNLLATAYASAPISITVEGANILTRTLMVFGQGAIRCHPFAYRQIKAVAEGDVAEFDRSFFGHVGHVVRNSARSLVLSVSRGRLAPAGIDGPAAPYLRKLAWSSASFAIMGDLAMASLGGDLKRKETLTGRYSDIFSWMYLATAAIRRFEAEGRREEDLDFFHWSMATAFARIQTGFDGLFRNFVAPRGLQWVFRGPLAFWSRFNPIGRGPSDDLGHAVARRMQIPGEQRDALTSGMYVSSDPSDALGRLERAFRLSHQAEAVAAKIKQAVRERKLPKDKPLRLVAQAVEMGILLPAEAALVAEAEAAREDVIQVDSFTLSDYRTRSVGKAPAPAPAAPASKADSPPAASGHPVG
ncbi:MAG TPA: acyl-CoA dehydrogenase [Planctomycetota bacterium]